MPVIGALLPLGSKKASTGRAPSGLPVPVVPSRAEGFLWAKWRRGRGIAMGAPTHRMKVHSTDMVTHNYGSASSATYQMAAAEIRLQ